MQLYNIMHFDTLDELIIDSELSKYDVISADLTSMKTGKLHSVRPTAFAIFSMSVACPPDV